MRAPILPPPATPKRKRKRRKSVLLSLLGWVFAAGVVAFVAGSAAAGYLLWSVSRDLPSYESLAQYEPPVMTRIHAHDGQLIAEYARQRRIFVPINTIPKLVIHAFLSAEDKRFYEHGGIDFFGIVRAFIRNLQNPGRRPEGASTITQQVAKNFLLSSEQKYERKLKEAILAIRIERAFSKDKILELYLNEIYLGIGSYGVAAAALNYFNKELDELTPEEAAYLAALPKAPNNYHPFRNTREATARRNWVLEQMAENGYITHEQMEAAKAKPLQVNLRPFGAHIFAAEFFAEEVRRTLLAKYGEDKLYGGGLSVRTTLDPDLQGYARQALMDGLVAFDRQRGWRGPVDKIDVTADWGATLAKMDVPSDIQPWRLGVVLQVERDKIIVGLRPDRQPNGKIPEQREAVEIAFEEMKWAGPFRATDKPKGPAPKKPADVVAVGDVIYVAPKDPNEPTGAWSLMQIPEVGGGIVAMDPHTGRVLAVVGGFSFSISQFDRAMQAKRQPGSAFKPLVYAAALDNGYTPTSIVLDAPIEIEQGPGQEVWRPQNYNKEMSYGPSTLRIGIEKSRNQMTARLAQELGMPLIIEYAKRFGAYDDLLPVLAMSLGAGETTLLRMAAAYSVFANGGKKVRPTLIDRIQDRWGRTIWRHDQRECPDCDADAWRGQEEPEIPDDRKQVLDPQTAYQMTSILEGVIQRGTATNVKRVLPGTPLAGKTGTTNESKDAWFVGYSPDLVVGVYVGYDTPKPMGKSATGGQVAAPIFANFMKMALDDKKVPFRAPPGIRTVPVNRYTGLRASPGEKDVIWEVFKPGEEPNDPASFLGYETSSYGDGVSPPPRNVSSGFGNVY
ncbi:MAG TPA: penicillin-binding protein 1A [Hyphomicrobiaceae bacterium]